MSSALHHTHKGSVVLLVLQILHIHTRLVHISYALGTNIGCLRCRSISLCVISSTLIIAHKAVDSKRIARVVSSTIRPVSDTCGSVTNNEPRPKRYGMTCSMALSHASRAALAKRGLNQYHRPMRFPTYRSSFWVSRS